MRLLQRYARNACDLVRQKRSFRNRSGPILLIQEEYKRIDQTLLRQTVGNMRFVRVQTGAVKDDSDKVD